MHLFHDACAIHALDVLCHASQDLGACLDQKFLAKSLCSTFRCYLVKFIQ
jgi:hypothetical protein